MHTDVQLAVLFADVVGSTRLYEQYGDAAARELVGAALDLMRDSTEAHSGTVIKTMGDEIMATFATAGDAIAAAAQMQRAIASRPQFNVGTTRIAIRIGCHFGPVMREPRDVFGATVHTANRLTSLAKAEQIMVTEEVVIRLPPQWQGAVRHVDIATLRGFSEEVALFEVLWHAEDATSVLQIVVPGAGGRTRSTRLRISVNGSELTLTDAPRVIQLGRGEGNELVVPGTLVSRHHARVEVSKTGFQFIDQSTNGSFVQPEGGEMQFVRRDTVTLVGDGRIGLGREPTTGDSGTIFYYSED
ncbi:MAG: adenylate/guanylate cyclase domain-containing protein [Pseudomonadota bacterium]